MRKLIIIGCVLVCCQNVLFSQELRTGLSIEKQYFSNLEFKAKVLLRDDLQAKRWVDNGILQVGFDYNLNKRFSLGGSYRYAREFVADLPEQDATTELDAKYRATADLTIKTKRFENDVKVRYRLRYQYSEENDGDSKTYLRTRLKADYKFNKKVEPYAAIEPYYSITEKEVTNFRIYVGSEFALLKNTVDVFIIYEIYEKHDAIKSSQSLGIVYCF